MEKEFIKYEIPSLHMKIRNYEVHPESEFTGIHIHSATEIICIEKGEVLCYVNQERIVLKENDTILINSYTVHYIEYIREAEITVIHIDINKVADMLISDDIGYIDEFIKRAHSKAYYIADKDDELSVIIFKIKDELKQEKFCYDIYVKAYLFRLAAFMYRNSMLVSEDRTAKETPEFLLRAIDFIDKNYNRKLTLEDICKSASYNKYHLCRTFKKITGGTIFEYINYVRVRSAEELLCNTRKSVSEVAFECGFASIQYFNRIFKRNTGYSPRSFKQSV